MGFDALLARWLVASSLGRRPATVRFYGHVARIMRQNWPNVEGCPAAPSIEAALQLAQAVSRFSPSLWNCIVSALRLIVPDSRPLLKRRAMRSRSNAAPSASEFAALLAECDRSKRPFVGLVVRFLALTGLRITEARALTWEDIGRDAIQVPSEASKNGKPRTVPVLDGLGALLDQLRAVGDGVNVLPRELPRKGLRLACVRANVRRFTFHSFRHLFATRCVQDGVDLPTLARWLGHQDGGALLARTYYHLQDEHSRRMASRVRIGTDYGPGNGKGRMASPVTVNKASPFVGSIKVGVKSNGCQSARFVVVNPRGVTRTAVSECITGLGIGTV
jgi:integrase